MARCQSCGMPLKKDPAGGGTEVDGSRSRLYCSLCYDGGEFRWQDGDVRDFQRMVVDEMTKDGWWRPVAWLMTRDIPRLERWKSA